MYIAGITQKAVRRDNLLDNRHEVRTLSTGLGLGGDFGITEEVTALTKTPTVTKLKISSNFILSKKQIKSINNNKSTKV